MKNLKISIIGGGNMGRAVAEGFVKAELPANSISITDRHDDLLEELSSMGFTAGSDNKKAVVGADIVILAVKPYLAETVLDEIRDFLAPGQMVASLMAGVDLAKLKALLPKGITPIRIIPNTAVSMQHSMTCIAAPDLSEDKKELVKSLFESLGLVIFIDEGLMGAATVLGSCGTAFALRYIRAAMEGGIEMGLGASVAQEIVAQTVKGAAELALNSGHHPELEIDRVTTPKGITISGLNEMEHQGFSSALIKGLIASFDKINNGK
jgi:pyrroline-5-carboxylate reductase